MSIETAGTLTLPAGGGATAAIPVSLIDDSFAEAPEFFLVRISASNNQGEVLSAFDTANITIIDNDRMPLHMLFTIILHYVKISCVCQ